MHALPLFLVPLFLAQAPAPTVKIDTAVRARAIEPFLDPATLAIAYVDVPRLDVDALAQELAGLAPQLANKGSPVQTALRTWVGAFLKAGGKDLYAVVSLADLGTPSNLPLFLVAPLQANADGKALTAALTGMLEAVDRAEQLGGAIVAAKQPTLERLRKLKPSGRPELAKALAQAGDATAQLLLLPPAHARRLLEETYPTLPAEWGGGSTAGLTRGFLWAAVTAEFKPQLTIRAVVQSQDAMAAQALADLRRQVFNALLNPAVRGELPLMMVTLAESFKPSVVGSQLQMTAEGALIRNVLAPLVQQAFADADRSRQASNLKQLGLALHSSHDVLGSFPTAAIFDKQGKPLLSWRVQILPYLDQVALYKEFKLDEPWDSPHNLKLVARMPAVFRSPASKAGTGKTNYLAPVHPATIFTGGPKGVKISEILDGTSNTILLVEADDEHAVVWTKPDDFKPDPAQPQKGLREYASKVFLVLYADGSVRFLPTTLDGKKLWTVFTRSGGEAVQVP